MTDLLLGMVGPVPMLAHNNVVTWPAQEDKRLKRREILAGLGLVGIAAGWQVWGVRDTGLVFEDISGMPGWEFGQAGAVSSLSGTDLITVGLEQQAVPLEVSRMEAVLHQAGGAGPRLAVFGDFFCPYCRVLMARVKTLQGVRVTWHELPLLGAASVLVARAAEAAQLQGGYLAFYDALTQQGFRPSESYLARVGAMAGLDAERLLTDMNGARVAQRLSESASAAARLGFYATPAIVIERTAILGAISEGDMTTLLFA